MPSTKLTTTNPSRTRPLSQKQQSILGFFDVPDSFNVAAQRKNATIKRKHTTANSITTKKANKETDNVKRTKNMDTPSSNVVARQANQQPSDEGGNETKKSKPMSTDNPEKVEFQKASSLLPERFPSALSATPRNIVLQLHQRSTRGFGGRITQPPEIPWSNAPWLKLSCPRSGNPLSDACLLEWDPMGVLLAVMVPDDSLLRIYDWDTVSATNAKGRNHRVRRKTNPQMTHTGGAYRIETTLHTNVRILGRQVRKLVWNPFDPDQIVILDRYVLHVIS